MDHSRLVHDPHVLIFPLPAQNHVNTMLKFIELLCLANLKVTFLNSHYIQKPLLRNIDIQARFAHYVPVWIQHFPLNSGLRFLIFFFPPAALFDQVNHEQCTRALFMDPQIPLFSNFFIKNRSHDTIHRFKNYFATVFSVSIFSFSKNKLNLNIPLVLC